MEDSKKKRIVFGILEFLGEEYNATLSNDAKESLEVATQCLETAFGITVADVGFKSQKSLKELYEELERGGGDEGQSPQPSGLTMEGVALNPQESILLRGTLELGPEYPLPPEATAEQKAAAEELKNKGNDAMRNSNYSEAMGYYNQAVELDGRNSVYFCNRAAAFLKLEQYDESLRDCQIAVRLQPNYARAYGRMGVTYSSRDAHVEAIMCYKKALLLEPDNQSYLTNLRYSQSLLHQEVLHMEGTEQTPTGPPSLQGLESIMRNPNLVSMASQMLQDPAMHQMIHNLMGGFGQAPPGQQTPAAAPQSNAPNGPAPGLEQLMFMGQQIANTLRINNPQIADQLLLNPQDLPNPDDPPES